MREEQSYVPKFAILQSTKNHLHLRLDNANTSVSGALRHHGDYSYGLDTRFEVVPAETETPDRKSNQLVHLRSMHNNKFWEKTSISGTDWITATADKPEEDLASPSCTLFEITFEPGKNNIAQLYHKSTGCCVLFQDSGLQIKDKSHLDSVKLLDWETIVVLPETIRIMANSGRQYLKAHEDTAFLHFEDIVNSPDFEYRVSASRDGGIRLQSVKNGKHLEKDHTDLWIATRDEYSSTDHPEKTVFIPMKLGDNTIALRNLGNNLFCKKYTYENKQWLATHLDHQDAYSTFTVEEPVLWRTINNVVYGDIRRFDEKTSGLWHDVASNGLETPATQELSLKTTITKTTNHSGSYSWSVGLNVSFEAGLPIIGKTGFEVHTEYGQNKKWDESETTSKEIGTVKTITLPGKKKVKGILRGTTLRYEIPYSYTQRDVLTNGHVKVTRKHDGLLTGNDGYGYKYDIVELPFE